MRPFLPLLLLLASTACVKPKPPVVAAQETSVALTAVRTELDSMAAVDAPERLESALMEELSSRNLRPVVVDGAPLFGDSRSPRWRLEQLASHASGAPVVLLVEAECRFYDQMAGRYRWTVHTTVRLAEEGHLDQPIRREFEVPVFLQFHHQRADDALAEATPTIVRRVGEVLDEYLAR